MVFQSWPATSETDPDLFELQKKSSSSCHNIEGFQNQLSKMRPMYARESYDTFVFVMYAREFTVEFHFSRMLVMKEQMKRSDYVKAYQSLLH